MNNHWTSKCFFKNREKRRRQNNNTDGDDDQNKKKRRQDSSDSEEEKESRKKDDNKTTKSKVNKKDDAKEKGKEKSKRKRSSAPDLAGDEDELGSMATAEVDTDDDDCVHHVKEQLPPSLTAKILDSGCSRHMVANKDLFISLRPPPRSMHVKVANGQRVGIGSVYLKARIRTDPPQIRRYCLKNVLYVPALMANLISIISLTKNNCNVLFENNKVLIRNKSNNILAVGNIRDKQYYLDEVPTSSYLHASTAIHDCEDHQACSSFDDDGNVTSDSENFADVDTDDDKEEEENDTEPSPKRTRSKLPIIISISEVPVPYQTM